MTYQQFVAARQLLAEERVGTRARAEAAAEDASMDAGLAALRAL